MARYKSSISVNDITYARKLIEEFLIEKKAKQVSYGNEIVWQFDNFLIGKRFLKVEYGISQVDLYAWVPANSAEGEMDLSGNLNWGAKSELKKIVEQLEALILDCSLSVDEMVNKALELDNLQKYDTAFSLYLRAAKLGNAFAQNQVGYAYMFGEGVNKDYTKAIDWLEKSAAQNFATAFNNLGVCYENGFGTAQDKYRALEYYQKAAGLDDQTAVKNMESVKKQLANQMTSDRLLKKAEEYDNANKYDMAFTLYLMAAESGNAFAQNQVGYAYMFGEGVSKDYTKAIDWLEKSAA